MRVVIKQLLKRNIARYRTRRRATAILERRLKRIAMIVVQEAVQMLCMTCECVQLRRSKMLCLCGLLSCLGYICLECDQASRYTKILSHARPVARNTQERFVAGNQGIIKI